MMEVTKPLRVLFLGVVSLTVMLAACSSDDPAPASEKKNGTSMLTDQNKIAMVRSLVDLEGSGGRIYEMNYTEDYRLEVP